MMLMSENVQADSGLQWSKMNKQWSGKELSGVCSVIVLTFRMETLRYREEKG